MGVEDEEDRKRGGGGSHVFSSVHLQKLLSHEPAPGGLSGADVGAALEKGAYLWSFQ